MGALLAWLVVLVVLALVTAAFLIGRHGFKAGGGPRVRNAVATFGPETGSVGTATGTVAFRQDDSDHPALVEINLAGLPAGVHGIHVHEYGDLSRGCDGACQHFNPDGRQHGSRQLFGAARHRGDLCNNITANSSGRATFSYLDDLIQLSGPYSVVGRSIVIHADADDLGQYRAEKTARGEGSAKTGNAGARIACAVIGIAGQNAA